MAAGLIDRDGALAEVEHVATPESGDPEAVWAGLEALIRAVVARAPHGRLSVCGVGCGGPMERDGLTVSPLNISGWRRFPLRARVAQLVGVPTAVDND